MPVATGVITDADTELARNVTIVKDNFVPPSGKMDTTLCPCLRLRFFTFPRTQEVLEAPTMTETRIHLPVAIHSFGRTEFLKQLFLAPSGRFRQEIPPSVPY